MSWHAAKKARSEDNSGSVKTKAQENGANAKTNTKKDESKGKSKNKKGDDNKVKNIQSQTEVPKGQLHSNVLVLLLFLFINMHQSKFIFEISFLVAHLL
jgi:nucleolar complex protein 3